MPETDSSLARRSLAGDRDAFGVFAERYAGLVHGVILERIRRPDEVEDLIQEAFAKAYQRLALGASPVGSARGSAA